MDDIKTEVVEVPRDESGGCSRFWPGGVRRKGGMSVALAFISNSGTSRVVVLVNTRSGSTPRLKPKARVPDATHWGGLGCISNEALLMRVEQRPQANGL